MIRVRHQKRVTVEHPERSAARHTRRTATLGGLERSAVHLGECAAGSTLSRFGNVGEQRIWKYEWRVRYLQNGNIQLESASTVHSASKRESQDTAWIRTSRHPSVNSSP
eukprot:3041680-Pleurochrysis_carterae.AAC.5